MQSSEEGSTPGSPNDSVAGLVGEAWDGAVKARTGSQAGFQQNDGMKFECPEHDSGSL